VASPKRRKTSPGGFKVAVLYQPAPSSRCLAGEKATTRAGPLAANRSQGLAAIRSAWRWRKPEREGVSCQYSCGGALHRPSAEERSNCFLKR